MARNIEIKARVPNRARLVERVQALAGDAVAIIDQDDCFFVCSSGRLKLRDLGDGNGELIAYERPDQVGPRASTYVRTETRDPAGLRDALSASLGVIGRVRKSRTLYIAGRTRIHLDRVEGLGDFMELEVVLAAGEHLEQGVAEAHQLMTALGVDEVDLCRDAYIDTLAAAAHVDTPQD